MANGQALTLSPGGFSLRPLLLLVGIAGAVAAGVAVMLWWKGPNWSLLYGNLEASDASQVTQALTTAGIEYKLNDATGAVMVPAEKVHEARMQLAGQGLPGNSGGISMINKDQGLGVSQFMETARYQYAIESELARTIGALRGVKAARVHLAISKESAFVRDRKPSGASVLLQLGAGARLENEQVQSIVHLVASSVPDLSADNVTVVDQQGRLLSAPGSPQAVIQNEQFAAAQRVEDTYAKRIEQLLVPMIGSGRVRAQVSVDLDASEAEESHEQYKPDSGVVRSESTSEQLSPANGGGSGGIPGALSNQPPQGGTVATQQQAAAANAANGANGARGAASQAQQQVAAAAENSSKSASRAFEIDRTLSYKKQPGGRIKRMTVAVLLDNPMQVGADGKSTATALTAEQIDGITKLVKGAVGFDEARGDSVSVVNAPFRNETEELKPEETPIWQNPMVQNIARLALGAVVLLVIGLGVLRPLMANLTAPPAGPQLAYATAGEAGLPAEAAMAAQQGAPGGTAVTASPGTPLHYEQQIAQAKTMVAQDPKRVAQVVKNWVGE